MLYHLYSLPLFTLQCNNILCHIYSDTLNNIDNACAVSSIVLSGNTAHRSKSTLSIRQIPKQTDGSSIVEFLGFEATKATSIVRLGM